MASVLGQIQPDELRLEQHDKENDCLRPSLPLKYKEEADSAYVQEFGQFYSTPYRTVEIRDEPYPPVVPPDVKHVFPAEARKESRAGVNALFPDAVQTDLCDPAMALDRPNIAELTKLNDNSRQPLLVAFKPTEPANIVSNLCFRDHPAIAPFQTNDGTSFLLHVAGLMLKDGPIEPLWGSFVLVNGRTGKRLSEEFSVPLNGEEDRMLVCEDPSPSHTTIFTVAEPSIDIFLVCRLFRVIQGDDATLDLMTRPSADRVAKHRTKNAAHFTRLRQCRQCILWSAMPVYSLVRRQEVPTFDLAGLNQLPLMRPKTPADLTDAAIIAASKEMLSPTHTQRLRPTKASVAVIGAALTMPLSTVRAHFAGSPRKPKAYPNRYASSRSSTVSGSPLVPAADPEDDKHVTLIPKLRVTPDLIPLKDAATDVSACQEGPCSASLPTILSLSGVDVSKCGDEVGLANERVKVSESFSAVVQPALRYMELMFVRLLKVDFNRVKRVACRNIIAKIQLFATDDVDAEPLKLILPKEGISGYRTEHYSATVYHAKTRFFSDEARIQLPFPCTESHHVRITFYHITVKDKPGDIMTPIGFTAFPLMQDDRLTDTELAGFPLAVEPVSGYLAAFTGRTPPEELQFHDRGQPIVELSAASVSTMHTSSGAIAGLYRLFDIVSVGHSAIGDRKTFDTHARETLRNLTRRPDPELVESLPVIMTVLFKLVVSFHGLPNGLPLAAEALIAIANFVSTVDGMVLEGGERVGVVDTYLKHVLDLTGFGGDRMASYIAVINTWTAVLTDKQYSRAVVDTVRTGWVFMDAIVKSIRLDLHSQHGGWPDWNSDRSGWFGQALYMCLGNLVTALIACIGGSKGSGGKVTLGLTDLKALATSTALFLYDLMYTCDHGKIFGLIADVLNQRGVWDDGEASGISDSRSEFLRVIFSHPLLVQLSHPVPLRLGHTKVKGAVVSVRNAVSVLSQDQRLPGILAEEVKRGLLSTKTTVRLGSAHLLHEVLHRADVRYGNDIVMLPLKASVATLFYPILLTILDHYTTAFARDISQSLVESQELVLQSALWILTSIEQQLLWDTLAQASPAQLASVSRILTDSVRLFSYSRQQAVKRESRIGDGVPAALDAKAELEAKYRNMVRGRGTLSRGSQSTLRGSRSSKQSRPTLSMHTTQMGTVNGALVPADRTESPAGEALLSVMHVMSEILTATGPAMATPAVATVVLDTVCVVAGAELSDIAARRLPILIQQLCDVASDQLFRGAGAEYTRTLVGVGLRLLGSKSADHRRAGVQLLYTLVRGNYREMRQINRVKFQMITGLSALSSLITDADDQVRASFAALSAYSEVDTKLPNHPLFQAAVRSMTETLATIVHDTVVVESGGAQDPETLADMYLRIADGYSATPALRAANLNMLVEHLDPTPTAAELEKIAKMPEDELNRHLEVTTKRPMVEAGIAVLYVAALTAEMLSVPAPPAMSAFGDELSLAEALRRHLSPVVPDMPVQLEADAQLLSEGSDEGTVVALLSQAARRFSDSQLYEFAHTVLTTAAQLCMHFGRFDELVRVQTDLVGVATHIRAVAGLHGERPIGTFYRVGFFGAAFGPLNDGKEYIYRESGLCRLPEIKGRLQDFWGQQLGPKLVMVTEGKPLNPAELDPDKAYLQLTTVKPFFGTVDGTTIPQPRNAFEAKTGVTHFFYENPYVVGGGKLSTATPSNLGSILTVLRTTVSLPAISKRSVVEAKFSLTIDPLQTSISTLEAQIAKLRGEAEREPPEIDSLQIIVAGSVRVQVNAGPAETARAFLKSPDGDERLADLKTRLVELVTVSFETLKVGKAIVPPDRVPFHVECVKGLRTLVADLGELVELPEIEWAAIEMAETVE
ncbi:Dock180/Zizimin C2 domain protein [Carpediemonas membranifera]|uniref:Dock180/Zizimin C2 domain protein n=1 Tax=Carpediemonas membranifera TaxID=201153 RepID=A0A8J6B8S2_9EUKA|nr:Dock180/Zizimin C2 domain protein [Carpediemonas membranifera]|eukprot:KAG9396589.1 Dock180/Zizimin C2 domain protein [Carpediemonas membranifera]